MSVFFLSFCCSLRFLGKCGGYVFPGSRFSGFLIGGVLGFHVKCVSRSWELTPRNEEQLERWSDSQEGRK